jgi:hypothetical protein
LPHFTLQIIPQGPLLTAYIGVSDAKKAALLNTNQPVPNLIQIRALVDTGASSTCVDPSVLQTLALAPTGQATVNTPSTGNQPHTADQYDASFIVPGSGATQAPLVVPNLPVICAELLQSQGFHALIGRDILSLCLLLYNGPGGFFTLAY